MIYNLATAGVTDVVFFLFLVELLCRLLGIEKKGKIFKCEPLEWVYNQRHPM